MKEFFGFGGYARQPEGYLSWQHISFVSAFTVLMIALAIIFGIKYKNKSLDKKRRVLLYTAIIMDGAEICKIIILCIREQDMLRWLYCLPLFLCSIQMITIPIAAFAKGKVYEACIDFIAIFGIIGALLGMYGAGQNYNAYPVLSLENVTSAITHSSIGFASLYVMIAKMTTLKSKNMPITFGILFSFCAVAYITNLIIDYNYMFLMSSDGTPYDIVYNYVNGNKVLYPLLVVALFIVYIFIFYFAAWTVQKLKKQPQKLRG